MPLEVVEANQEVVVGQMSAHDVVVEVCAVFHGNAYLVVLIHDVYGKILREAVAVDDLPVVLAVVAHIIVFAAVGSVAFHDGAVHIVHKVFDEFGLEIVGIGSLAGAHLHGHAAFGLHAEGLVYAYQRGWRNLTGEVHFGLCPCAAAHGNKEGKRQDVSNDLFHDDEKG